MASHYHPFKIELPARWVTAGQGENRDSILTFQRLISWSGLIVVLLSLKNILIREFCDARIGEEMRLSSMPCDAWA